MNDFGFSFTRKQTVGGTEFHAERGRVVIRKTSWTKPGFKGITSTGWVVEADGEQIGAAYPTATVLVKRLSGGGEDGRIFRSQVQAVLDRNNRHDDGSEEALKDEVLRTVLDWVEDGAEIDLGALGMVKDAAAALRTFRAQRNEGV